MADHYIEYELILIVLDLALHKVQAYRHLLFNRRPYCDLDYAGVSLSGLDCICYFISWGTAC